MERTQVKNANKTKNKLPANGLRGLRHAALMTQKELAKASRLSIRSIQLWELGASPRIPQRRALLRVFGIPLSEHERIFGPLA